MQSSLAGDVSTANWRVIVSRVELTRKSESSYIGYAIVQSQAGQRREVSVTVTLKGDNITWDTEPGGLRFDVDAQRSLTGEGPPRPPDYPQSVLPQPDAADEGVPAPGTGPESPLVPPADAEPGWSTDVPTGGA